MLTIKKEHLEQMVIHCNGRAPAEACGLLSGSNEKVLKLYPMTNIDTSNKRYLIDPKEQFAVFKKISDSGTELLGIFHSHVATDAYPSPTDIEMAVYDVVYFIVSLKEEVPVIKAFSIKEGKVEEQEFAIVDR